MPLGAVVHCGSGNGTNVRRSSELPACYYDCIHVSLDHTIAIEMQSSFKVFKSVCGAMIKHGLQTSNCAAEMTSRSGTEALKGEAAGCNLPATRSSTAFP